MEKKTLLSITAALLLASCGTDDFTSVLSSYSSTGSSSVSGGTLSTTEIGTTDIESFDISLNTTALSDEEEAVSTDNEDFVESFLAEETDGVKKLVIDYDGTAASWTYYKKSGAVIATSSSAGDAYTDDDVSIEKSGAHVTVRAAKKLNYVLQGTATDGNFKLYSDKKFILDLNGVTLTNHNGAAINIQKGTDGDKRCYLRIADGTVNVLSDGATYSTPDDEEEKGVVFSEGKLLVSGKGTLRIAANGKHGIVSDDYIYLHAGTNTYITPASDHDGIKANDGIYIAGGVHNISCSGDAPKGLACDSLVSIMGGRTTIVNSGQAAYDSSASDYSQPSCVKCDSAVVVSGGELLCKSTGNGGKGIRAAQYYTQHGGTVKVITSGTTVGSSSQGAMPMNFSSSVSDAEPKGLHVGSKSLGNGLITINGGKLVVRCTGGEGAEGIESKNKIVINGGMVESHCYDDAINARSNITINGGYVYANATNNDGIDSNGTLNVNGGVAISCGASAPEEGFDCDQNTFTITGGIIVGIGGTTSTPTASLCTQPSLVTSVNLSAGAAFALAKSDGTAITAFRVPSRYNGSYTLLLSAPQLTVGSTCNILSGATIDGTSFHGLACDGITLTGGTTSSSYTLNNMVTGNGSSGMMPGMRM